MAIQHSYKLEATLGESGTTETCNFAGAKLSLMIWKDLCHPVSHALEGLALALVKCQFAPALALTLPLYHRNHIRLIGSLSPGRT